MQQNVFFDVYKEHTTLEFCCQRRNKDRGKKLLHTQMETDVEINGMKEYNWVYFLPR